MKHLIKKSLLLPTLLLTMTLPVIAQSKVEPMNCYPILGCVPPVKTIEIPRQNPTLIQSEN